MTYKHGYFKTQRNDKAVKDSRHCNYQNEKSSFRVKTKVKEIQAGQMIKSTMIGSHLKLTETKQKKNIRLKLLGIESKSERAPKTKTV